MIFNQLELKYYKEPLIGPQAQNKLKKDFFDERYIFFQLIKPLIYFKQKFNITKLKYVNFFLNIK